MKTIFVFLLLLVNVFAAPWFDLFGTNSYNQRRSGQRQGKGGKERWKEICRTINPDGFAFPGSAPYPAAPACPY